MADDRLSRRDALRHLAAGGIGLTSTLWVKSLDTLAREGALHAHDVLSSAAQAGTAKVLEAHQLSTVATLSELIIPETDTPGARAAMVDRFIDAVLAEAQPVERNRFLRGLA